MSKSILQRLELRSNTSNVKFFKFLYKLTSATYTHYFVCTATMNKDGDFTSFCSLKTIGFPYKIAPPGLKSIFLPRRQRKKNNRPANTSRMDVGTFIELGWSRKKWKRFETKNHNTNKVLKLTHFLSLSSHLWHFLNFGFISALYLN